MMEIGYAQDLITPELDRPVFMAGFGQNRRAESVHDDLYVRALALNDGSKTVVLCALDLIGFFHPDVNDVIRQVKTSDRFLALNHTPAEIIIASVHPHHGPDTMGLWGPDTRISGVDTAYMGFLKQKIVSTILSALENLEPAPTMNAVALQVPGLAKNARNAAIIDDELIVLQFLDAAGNVQVNLFNFACHPEVLWEHNPHITADYPGELRWEVERLSGAPCIFLPADLGGMMTPDVKDHSFAEAEFMGKALAKAGMEAAETAVFRPEPGLSFHHKEIHVKLTNILFKIAIKRGLFPDIRDEHGMVHSEVNLIKIGPAWFATVPGELLPQLGLEIKAALRKAGAELAGVIGLANDELGYILPKADFRFPLNPFKPGRHYEETNSISKEIGPIVLAAVQQLIEESQP